MVINKHVPGKSARMERTYLGEGRKRMETDARELKARVWCLENDVNVLQVCPLDDDHYKVMMVVEYSVMLLDTNKKIWCKMAISAVPSDTMSEAMEEVMQVRAAYYASKQQ